MAFFNKNGEAGNGQQSGFKSIDASGLDHPLDMPKRNYLVIVLCMAIALAIGSFAMNAFQENVIHGAENQQKAVNELLYRGVSLNLPKCSKLITMSNSEIKHYLVNTKKVKLYDNSSDEDRAAKGFDFYKIPKDVSKTQAATDISNGLAHASSMTIAMYLPTSWRLLMNRTEGKEIKLKYTDLEANTPEQAIKNAIKNQGFNKKKAGKITQDSAGNYTQSGTIKIKGKVHYWTISTCDVSAVYSAGGLPQSAQYVGITLAKR